MPCCQRPVHILDICYHQRLEAESPPFLCRIPAGAARPLHNCIFTVLCSIYTKISQTMRGCRGSGVFLGLYLRRNVEYVEHVALNYTWGFIVVLIVVRFATSRNAVVQHTDRRCLLCSTELLTYMNRPVVKIWYCITWAKNSCGSFNHTLKKDTAGKKKTLLKY